MRRTSVVWFALPAIVAAVPLLLPGLAGQDEPPKRNKGGKIQSAKPQSASGENGGDEGLDTGDENPAKAVVKSTPRDEHGYYSNPARLRQNPFLLERRSGETLLGFLEWDAPTGDWLMVQTIAPGGDGEKHAPPKQVTPKAVEMLRPVGVLDANDRLHCFWTQIEGEVGQIWTAAEQEDGKFSPPLQLTNSTLTSKNVESTLGPDGRVWVAWESDRQPTVAEKPSGASDGDQSAVSKRTRHEILLAPIGDDGKLGAATTAASGRYSELDPSLTSSGGKLWLAWSSYTGRDFDVLLRSVDAKSGALGDVVNVSAESWSDDVHPNVAAGKDGDVWVAWDWIAIPHRGKSLPPEMRPVGHEKFGFNVHCACVRDGKVLVAPVHSKDSVAGTVEGAPVMSSGGGGPHVGVDRRGRVWIAYRYLVRLGENDRDGFPVIVQHLNESGWSDPFEVQPSTGFNEEPAVGRCGDGAVVAFVQDQHFDAPVKNMLRRSAPDQVLQVVNKKGIGIDRWFGPAGIGVAHVDAADEPVALPPLTEHAPARDRPHFHPSGDLLDDPIVNGEEHLAVTRGDDHWFVYWGELHRHTTVSRCLRGVEPMPEDRWIQGRDQMLCDFMALTDHSRQFDLFSWWQCDKLFRVYDCPSFATFAGYEWSTTEYGHQNVILPGRLQPMVGDTLEIDEFYDRLKKIDCVAIPHHPSHNKFPNDFPTVDDSRTRLIEVYQARRGNFEFDGCYRQAHEAGTLGSFTQDALNQGHKFGIIASSDHGFGQAYACALATSLDRASIYDALKNRRTYGATTKGMYAEIRADGAMMGEEVAVDGAPKIQVVARGVRELADVVVFRNGHVFQSLRSGAGLGNALTPVRVVVKLTPSPAKPDSDWFVRVKLDAKPDERVHFEELVDHRPAVRRAESAPKWSSKDREANFDVPSDFEVKPAATEYPIHLVVPPDCKLTIRTPDATRTVTLDELVTAPFTGVAPNGGKYSVRLDYGDGVVDLGKSLGTKEFTGEWEDSSPRKGPTWYYVRIVQVDGEMAWSSPVFVDKK
jgi:hypothetical protein